MNSFEIFSCCKENSHLQEKEKVLIDIKCQSFLGFEDDKKTKFDFFTTSCIVFDILVGCSLCLFEDGGKIEKVVYAKIEHACVAMCWFPPFFGVFLLLFLYIYFFSKLFYFCSYVFVLNI